MCESVVLLQSIVFVQAFPGGDSRGASKVQKEQYHCNISKALQYMIEYSKEPNIRSDQN